MLDLQDVKCVHILLVSLLTNSIYFLKKCFLIKCFSQLKYFHSIEVVGEYTVVLFLHSRGQKGHKCDRDRLRDMINQDTR
jgi:hypothetical protein